MKRRKPKLTDRRRRLRVALRKARWSAAALLVAAALIAADRAGFFGTRPAQLPEDYARFHAKPFPVTRVVDGDTLDVDAPDGAQPHTRIRLWGVDTPETKHPHKGVGHFGPEAERFTRQACAGKVVRLELLRRSTRDRHGRLLAYVILPDGRMLNRELVRLGFGYADPRYPHTYQREFDSLQAEARTDRRGLWQDVREQDLPYYFRPAGRSGRAEGRP